MKSSTVGRMSKVIIFTFFTSATAAFAHSGETYVVCNIDPSGANDLALRACGSNKCELLLKLPNHATLLAAEPFSGSHWRKVTVLIGKYMLPIGPDGWVFDRFLCELAD